MHRSALLPALAPGSFRASEWTDVYWSARPHFPSPLRLSPMTRNTACVGTKESLLVWWMELCALPGKLINVFLLVSFFFSLSFFFSSYYEEEGQDFGTALLAGAFCGHCGTQRSLSRLPAPRQCAVCSPPTLLTPRVWRQIADSCLNCSFHINLPIKAHLWE